MKPLWADLHNHNEIGYGVGTLDRSYAMAEALLDVYAMVPHGHWPDPPATDPKLLAEHEAGFDRVAKRFGEVIDKANARYAPGKFVSFVGFEWHSSQWGDYQVIFPGNHGELFRARNLEELQSFARKHGALLIQHHVGYKHGWRGANWIAQDPLLTPVIEVFSEHGNSVEALSHATMLGHSMGGTTRSQTAMAQLATGRRFGLIAGTDTHNGHPASYNEGLTAILATDLSRESVFEALRARHTYAVTGDRIGVELRSNGAIMGDVLPFSTARDLQIAIDPLAPIEFVKLIRNGNVVQSWCPPIPLAQVGPGEWLVRIDWGWDRLGSREMTLWEHRIELVDGRIVDISPCFSAGPLGFEHHNRITSQGLDHAAIESFTSRDNPVPVAGIVLRLQSLGDCRLNIAATSDTAGQKGGCEIRTRLSELLRDDVWAQALPRFSAPKMRVGQPWPTRHLRLEVDWVDPMVADPLNHKQGDSYMLKVQQANGQMAWSTPIWFADQP